MGSIDNEKLIRQMKTQGHYLLRILLLILCLSLFSQVNSQPNPPTPTCAICGGKNGVHAKTCPYYNPPATSGTKTRSAGMPNQIQQLNMLIELFNNPSESKEADREAARRAAEEAKMREEALRKAQHEKVMKEFKSLDDQGKAAPAQKSVSGLNFKPLPSAGAPMTQEERERQNLTARKVKITWNYDEFSNISPDNKLPEPVAEPELTDNEKLVNEMIAKVESNGGRLAAVTGRYILNLKDGVMNYLDDATYAVTSGNSFIMQETGEFDVKKITVNALYKTANQTAKIYYDNAKDAVSGGLKDASIGVISGATINYLQKYKYFDDLAAAWQQTR